ncbi:MAG: histidine kinase [Oscillatoria sp. SIO1A7]|nr:histidine kinase [Oscillatoria sp. SIO1A7]
MLRPLKNNFDWKEVKGTKAIATFSQCLKLLGKDELRSPRYLPAWLSAIAGLGLSAAAAAMVWKWEAASTQKQFPQQANNITLALQRNIDQYLQATEALRALYDASDWVDSLEFAKFSQAFLTRYSGIAGIGWAERVLDYQRLTYEQAMQAEGFADFRIRNGPPRYSNAIPANEGDSPEFLIASDREEYFPTTYIEPLNRLGWLLGTDHSTDPENRFFLEKARDTGSLAASSRLSIGKKKAPGFIIYQPVYRKWVPLDTVADRRQYFEGVVYAIYEIQELVKTSILSLSLDKLDFNLYEMSAEELNYSLVRGKAISGDRLLIFYNSATQKLGIDPDGAKTLDANIDIETTKSSCSYSGNRLFCIRSLQIADRQWSLLILPVPDFAEAHWKAAATLTIGLLSTSLLAIYLWMSIRRSVQTETLVAALQESNGELEEALSQLQQTQLQLIQSEKMSSLGQLVAGVTHEINNPVSFIYGNISHALDYADNLLELLQLYALHYPDPHPEIKAEAEAIDVDFVLQDFPKMMSSMKMGAERIKEIVESLRNFSRLDESGLKIVNIHEGIESTLLILQNQFNEQGRRPPIKVIKDYSQLPKIESYPRQLNQVFMNIISNAIDALKEGEGASSSMPEIRIKTEMPNSNRVTIRISDNGPGMTDEVKQKIFNPFFTTKPVGQGTGMGLSISYQIITVRHRGRLDCISEEGKGTEFLIQIPTTQTHNSVII